MTMMRRERTILGTIAITVAMTGCTMTLEYHTHKHHHDAQGGDTQTDQDAKADFDSILEWAKRPQP